MAAATSIDRVKAHIAQRQQHEREKQAFRAQICNGMFDLPKGDRAAAVNLLGRLLADQIDPAHAKAEWTNLVQYSRH